MGVRLPAEYQEVDFLESTGTQYIVFPISNITKTDEFELVVQRLSNTYTSCFGYSGNGKYYDINLRQGSSPYPTEIAWGKTGVYVRSTSELPTDRFHKIALRLNDSNKLVGSIDGNQMPGSITPSAASLDAPLRLFGRSGANYYAITRFKSFRYWRDSSVSCDMISCYRKSDNKPGMYDLVSGEFLVNQGTGEFLIGHEKIDPISPLMVAWRRIMMAAASVKKLVKQIITSATGFASFNTNVEMPTKVTCEFNPIQEGTGNPSPDNVRPIIGWTGCKISSGKITLPEEKYGWIPGYLANQYGGMGNQDPTRLEFTSDYIPVNGGETINLRYKLASNPPDSNWYGYLAFDKNKQPVGSRQSILRSYTTDLTESFTLDQNAAYFRLSLRTFGLVMALDINNSNISIPITFTDPSTGDPMTVYGGTVTLNEDGSADLVADRTVVDIPNLDWSQYSTNLYFHYFGYEIDTSKVVCDIYKTVDENFAEPKDYAVGSNPSVSYNKMLFINDLRYETIEDFKAGNANTQLIINAESPQTYHFPNIAQLNSFLGQNNIWHNMNGDITVEYWKNQ